MKIKKLISIASRGYPDGLVAEAAKGKDVEDTLATFIAKELHGISETDSDYDQLVEAVRLIGVAIDDLQGVVTELSHCAENAKRKANGVKPLYPERASSGPRRSMRNGRARILRPELQK